MYIGSKEGGKVLANRPYSEPDPRLDLTIIRPLWLLDRKNASQAINPPRPPVRSGRLVKNSSCFKKKLLAEVGKDVCPVRA